MTTIMGVPVITSEHFTKTIFDGKVRRRFKAGARKGKNKQRVKVYRLPAITIPDPDFYMFSGRIAMHPSTLYRIQAKNEEMGQDSETSINSVPFRWWHKGDYPPSPNPNF